MKLVLNDVVVADIPVQYDKNGCRVAIRDYKLSIAILDDDPIEDDIEGALLRGQSEVYAYTGTAGKFWAEQDGESWSVRKDGATKPAHTGLSESQALEKAFLLAWKEISPDLN